MADRAKGIPVAKEGIPFITLGSLLTLGCWMAGWVGLTWLARVFDSVYRLVFSKSRQDDSSRKESDCFSR